MIIAYRNNIMKIYWSFVYGDVGWEKKKPIQNKQSRNNKKVNKVQKN